VSPFELVEPTSLGEAVALLDRDDPEVRVIGGGTALMLMMKAGFFSPKRLVSLRALAAPLAEIAASPEGGLRIGAMVRLSELERATEVQRLAPVIPQTLVTHSNVRVRNVATVGGNLAHGDPHMDMPPVLIALAATVEAVGPHGDRTIAVEDLFAGYFETVLAGDEVISAVAIPPQPARRTVYAKVTTRAADDWPALGIALSAAVQGDKLIDPRVVVSAATEKPMRLPQTEALLGERAADGGLLREAGRCAAAEAPIVADAQGSASYKRVLLGVHLWRAVQRLLTGETAS